MGEAVGEFEGGDEARLLVQAAEVTDQVNDGVLFLEGFIGQSVIECIEGLLDLVGVVGAHMLVIGIVQEFQDGVGIGAEFLHIHNSVLLVVCREVQTGVGVEFLELDLGFEAVLGFHYHVYQFVSVGVPLFDPAQVSGAAFVVDDEGHHIVAQTFLEHKQSTDAAIAVLEGEDFLKTDMEVQNVVALDLGLLFVCSDQLCQSGMDLVRVQELAIPGTGCDGAVLTGAHLLFVLVHRAGHQEVVELADKLLGQRFHHVVKDIVHAMDMVQHLDHIGDFEGLEGLPNLALFEDGFHLLSRQPDTCHPRRRISQVNDGKIVQTVKIPLFLLILQLFGQFWQLRLGCIAQICP